jgi:cell division ATPase FtsA
VLVGGGANLKAIEDYAKEKLRLPVRVAKLSDFTGITDRVAKPEFATVLGLMLLDFEQLAPANQHSSSSKGAAASGQATLNKFMHQASALFKKFKS